MEEPQTNPVGRSLAFHSVDDLQQAIDEYFQFCDDRIQQVYDKKSGTVIEIINPEPYTMAGLAYAVGVDRKTIYNYSKKDEFFLTIKRAREKVQTDVERRLMEGQATGAIFNLKNNFEYVDKTEVDQKLSGELKTGEANPELAAKFAEFMKQETLDKTN